MRKYNDLVGNGMGMQLDWPVGVLNLVYIYKKRFLLEGKLNVDMENEVQIEG